jgi:hypothetical protein
MILTAHFSALSLRVFGEDLTVAAQQAKQKKVSQDIDVEGVPVADSNGDTPITAIVDDEAAETVESNHVEG